MAGQRGEDVAGGVARAATTADRRHVARMATVIEVITHALDCGMLALRWG
jgi:hypothetical protein